MADQAGFLIKENRQSRRSMSASSLSPECHDFVKRNFSGSSNAALLSRDSFSFSSSERCEPFHVTLRQPQPAPQIQELVAGHNKPHPRRLLSNIQHEDPSHRPRRILKYARRRTREPEVCAVPKDRTPDLVQTLS